MTPALIIAGVVIVGMAWTIWAQRREIERMAGDIDHTYTRWCANAVTLHAIADATRDGKSGTARKVFRMASEAVR